MKIYLSLFLCFIISHSGFGQKIQQDSISSDQLEEVVVTGQFGPQSIKKSLFNVRVITKQDIKNLAANNLSDVLNQYLNINIRTSGSDGRSTVSMFGLDSQYFKILVDNVPLVSDTGLGTNIDLTQVNLDDIEQIEIIEGSMGVIYGANAVSGILNIITKKRSLYKWEITATVQEETVSDEFALFDKGRHIESAKITHNINDDWFVSIGGNRNDFAGFYDGRQGKDHILNDGLRGHSWLPKEQLAGNALIGYNKNAFRFFYKFDYFGENVDFYDRVVIPQDNYPFPDTYYSKDKRFISNRFYHHLNAYGKLLSKLNYNVSVSHQKQQRDVEKFNYQLETQQESLNDRQVYQSKEVAYSTGNISNFFNKDKFDLQIGYEAVNERGFFDATAGNFRNDQQLPNDINKRLENYDFFASAEINLTKAFSIRPGYRYSFQSRFDDQYAASLGFRYSFPKNIEARASLGQSYRTPNFDELYSYFVDSNHNLTGNPDLIPEKSTSYEVSLKKTTNFNSDFQLSNTMAVTYMDVNDRISMILEQAVPSLAYRYNNIDEYKMWNISATNHLAYKNWNVTLGAALVGISQVIDLGALDVVSSDKFLYSFQMNSNVSYNLQKWNTLFSVYYKFNGKQQQYTTVTNSDNETQFVISELESYGWMDASIRKSFYKNKFEATLGARNVLNVQTVQLTGGSTGTGIHSANSNVLLGYGRSFFLKLTYNLNF